MKRSTMAALGLLFTIGAAPACGLASVCIGECEGGAEPTESDGPATTAGDQSTVGTAPDTGMTEPTASGPTASGPTASDGTMSTGTATAGTSDTDSGATMSDTDSAGSATGETDGASGTTASDTDTGIGDSSSGP